jgi:hypothetical protein
LLLLLALLRCGLRVAVVFVNAMNDRTAATATATATATAALTAVIILRTNTLLLLLVLLLLLLLMLMRVVLMLVLAALPAMIAAFTHAACRAAVGMIDRRLLGKVVRVSVFEVIAICSRTVIIGECRRIRSSRSSLFLCLCLRLRLCLYSCFCFCFCFCFQLCSQHPPQYAHLYHRRYI